MNALGTMIPFVGQGISTVLSQRATRSQADRERAEAEFQAVQLEQQSGQEKAASQRVSADEQRRARYAESRALAVAGASGAGGKTVTDVIGRIAQEGAYRSSVALYQGESEARQMLVRAQGVRASGRASESAWNTAAQISLLKDASSLYSKYGRNSPAATSTAPVPSGGFSEGSYLDAGSVAEMAIA